MEDVFIKVKCARCDGTGIDDVSPNQGKSCIACNGTGWANTEKLNTVGKCPTSLILENTDDTEYAALDANKKAYYNLYVSAGTLDMSEGAKANDLFLAWIFPQGKASHTAILNALASL